MTLHHTSAVVQVAVSAAGVPCASGFDLALAGLGIVARFDRNEVLFTRGDAARDIFKIVSGTVRIYQLMSDGRRQIVRFNLPGDFLALDEGKIHALSAEAIGDVITIRHNRDRLTSLAEDQLAVRQTIFEHLRRDLWAAQDHLLLLGRQVPRERIAHFLLEMEARISKCRVLELPMGRQDIADYLGLTIETVSRVLAELKREGHITLPSRHGIIVRNLGALHAIADAMPPSMRRGLPPNISAAFDSDQQRRSETA